MLKTYISIFLFFILIIKANLLLFQDNLIRKINSKTKNTLISPLSLYQFLSLLSNGGSDKIKKELNQVFCPNKADDDVDTFMNKINSNVIEMISNIESEKNSENNQNCEKGEDCKIQLNDVHGLFIKEGYELTEKYKQICDNYSSEYFKLDGIEQINAFCSRKTNGKIQNCIGLLPDYATLVLANAIYFKGAWEDIFSEFKEKRPFLCSNGTTVSVETMNEIFWSKQYYKDEKVEIISLPYKSNKLDFNMIIILPNLNKYSSPLDYLNKENIALSEINSKLKDTENIRLYLPKFKINFNIKLRSIFEEMGLKSIFDSSEIDGIFKAGNPIIEDIYHITYIDVNENGTEASAVTINIFNSTGPTEDIVMDVNHSFIFMIQSNQIKDTEGNYLMPFVGIINELEEKKDIQPTKVEPSDISKPTKDESTDESTDDNKSNDKDESTDDNKSNDKAESTDDNKSNDKVESTDDNKSNDKVESTDDNKSNDKAESTDGNLTIDDEPSKININFSKYFKINFTIITSLIILML